MLKLSKSLIAVFFSIFLISGCSISDSFEGINEYFTGNKFYFKSGPQYIQLDSENSGVKNIHPINISTQKIENALRLVLVKYSTTAEPLFSDEKVHQFSIGMSEALKDAESDEDVVFAVEGWYKDRFVRDNRITSGRVFYNRSGLNIIFGSILRKGPQQDDPLLSKLDEDIASNPYVPGSRYKSIKNAFILAAVPNSGIFRPKSANNRADWLVFSSKAMQQRVRINQKEKKLAHTSNIQVQGLRSEVQKLRQELQSMRQYPNFPQPQSNYYSNYQPPMHPYQYYNQPYQAYYPPQQQYYVPQQQFVPQQPNIELSLKSLKNMRERGLISEEDYIKKLKELGY